MGEHSHRPGRYNGYLILTDMKAIWMILSLVFGLLFFAYGCLKGSDTIQYFGAIVLIPGLIGLCDAIWPEKAEEGE